jgi:hypothetical protein
MVSTDSSGFLVFWITGLTFFQDFGFLVSDIGVVD